MSIPSTIVATRDSAERTGLKTPHGVFNLPTHQARNQFVPTYDVVRTFSANSTGSWSTTSEFILTPDQLPHIVDKFTLVLNMAAASKTGGTYIGLVNDAAWLSRQIEVFIGGELLSTIYPERVYLENLLHQTNESKLKIMTVGGNDTQAHRRSNAAAGQTLYLDIPIPFIQKYGWQSGQSQAQIRIKVYHNDLSTIVDTDGTAPVLAFNSVSLNVAGRIYSDPSNVVALSHMQKKLGKVDQRFLDVVQQQLSLPSGSTNYVLQLTNLVGLFDHLLFVVRTAASVGTPLANAPDSFVAVASYNLKDSAGNFILPETAHAYALANYTNKYVTGDGTDVASGLGTTQKSVYPVFFGSRPEESLTKGTQHGFFKFDGLTKLQLTFAAALNAAHVVDVIGYVWSNVSADANGQVKKSTLV